MRSSQFNTCDVLIVGGGPTGLVLAGLLARRGVDVAVLERRSSPRLYSRAIGLHPPALAVLDILEIEDAVRAEGILVRSGTAYSGEQELGTLSFERAWPDRPFVVTLPQNRTEALLIQRLAELAPDALHLGWEVTAVQEVGQESLVTARRVEAGGAGSAVMTWRAQVVIGADGPRSLVRSAAGIRSRLRELPDKYVMGDFHDPSGSSTADIYLEPNGVIEAFPLPRNTRRWVAHTGKIPVEAIPETLAKLVTERSGASLDAATATMISAFSVRRRLAARMVSGRQVIIGDAAHEISPIGGQGMTLGWLDAIELVPLLLEGLTSGDQRPLTERPAFRRFEQTRLRTARAAARQAELNMMLGRPMPAFAATARDAVLRGLLRTSFRHRFAQAFTMRRPLTGPETQTPE